MTKNLINKIVSFSKMGMVYSSLFKKPNCAIVCYHRVDNLSSDLLKSLIVSPEEFEKQILYLKENYKIISLDQLEDFLLADRKYNSRAVAITFDDAYEGVYKYVFPILKKNSIPASVFVPTSFVETKKKFWWDRIAFFLNITRKSHVVFNYKWYNFVFGLNNSKLRIKTFNRLNSFLKGISTEKEIGEILLELKGVLGIDSETFSPSTLSWDQMREMAQGSISFGSHGKNHLPCSLLGERDLFDEIKGSKKILENNLGKKIYSFAYPFGGKTDFDARSFNIIYEAGYKYAFTSLPGIATFGTNYISLPRLTISGFDTLASLKNKLEGLTIPIYKFKSFIGMLDTPRDDKF